MLKKISKILSLFLVIAVLMSCTVIVSHAEEEHDTTGFKTDIMEYVGEMREAMANRENAFSVKFKTDKEFHDNELISTIDNFVAEVYAPTDESYLGDYLYYSILKLDYNNHGSSSQETKDDITFYYQINFNLQYFTNASQEQELAAKIKEVINSFGFNASTTDKEKCDTIHRYIVDNVRYDNENLNDDAYTLKYSAYAALINKTAVCQGYASLFYRLAKECGLDVRIIAGSSKGVGHAWNIVKLDGIYYYLDSTWDAGTNVYHYYLKGTNDFDEHTSNAEFLTPEFQAKYPISADNYGKHSFVKIYEDKFRAEYECSGCHNRHTELFVPSGETLAQDYDGVWYYLVDGVKNSFTTVLEFENQLCYVKNGIWDRSTSNLLINFDDKYYYITNGVWNKTFTDIINVSGKHMYIENGVWNTAKTGFVENEGKVYYVKNGEQSQANGFVNDGGKYYQIKNGVKVSDDAVKNCGSAFIIFKNNKFVYNGKVQKPKPNIYDANGNKLSSKNYKITYSKGRKAVGKYSLTIKFKGKYKGSAKLSFTIIPKTTKVSKLAAIKKGLKVTVKKQTKEVTGYQIQYATTNTFAGAKTKTISKNKTTTLTIKGLKAKRNYFVRVRTFKKVGKTKIYSEWSKVKTKKTK